jgi:WD40 repeat protein
MDAAFKPFRTWEPVTEGSYQVNDLKFSTAGDRILLASATNQAKMFTREAEEVCVRVLCRRNWIDGDVAAFTRKATCTFEISRILRWFSCEPHLHSEHLAGSGHVAEITQVVWHPKDENTFMTSSHDSTVRIWDANKRDKSKQVIVVKSKERGQRTHITACGYSEDARWIAAAGLDGCINVWGTNSNFVRPNYVCGFS